MADYAIEGGRFLRACEELVTAEFRISWYDRFPAPELVAAGQQCEAMQLSAAVGGGTTPAQALPVATSLVVWPTVTNGVAAPATNKTNRVKFTCGCGQNIWGKPSLRVLCMACDTPFRATNPTAAASFYLIN